MANSNTVSISAALNGRNKANGRAVSMLHVWSLSSHFPTKDAEPRAWMQNANMHAKFDAKHNDPRNKSHPKLSKICRRFPEQKRWTPSRLASVVWKLQPGSWDCIAMSDDREGARRCYPPQALKSTAPQRFRIFVSGACFVRHIV